MRKNIFASLILTIAVMISCFSTSVHAANEEAAVSTSIEYFDDGSYAVITITENVNNSRASVKSGTKTYTHKNSDGETLWTYTITGTFSYTGTSSTCTGIADSYTISNDNWHMDSHSCSKKGNTVYGTVTMKYKVLGVTLNTVTKNISLTCSATGVLS